MKASENQKTQKPLPTERQHLALCVAIVDLGTQQGFFNGAPTSSRKIVLTFEIPGEKAVFKAENGAQPFTVSAEYTFSLDSKANFRKAMDSWIGQPVTELDSEKLTKLLKKPAMIQVVHNTAKDGIKYANIANKGVSIFKRPADVAFPKETHNTPVFFDLDNFSWESFDLAPKWLQDKISKSPEFIKASTAKPRAGAAPQTSGAIADNTGFDDEDPF